MIGKSFQAMAASIPPFDQGREAELEQLMREQLYPWFVAQASESLIGTPRADGEPVKLRAKAFVEKGAKANILLLHGYDEEMEKYIELVWDFRAAGYNVFLFDLRGFGFSSRLEDKAQTVYIDRFDAYIEDVQTALVPWLESKAPGLTLFLFGHSTGAAVATGYAQKNPQRVRGLILSSPLFEMSTDPLPPLWAGRLARLVDSLGAGASLVPGQGKGQDYWDFSHSDNTSKARFQAFFDIMQKPEMQFSPLRGPSFRFLGEVSRALEEMKATHYRLSIATPILLFQAEKDSWVKPQPQSSFCTEVKNCQFERVRAARHAIYAEGDTMRIPYLRRIFGFLEAHQPSQKP
jgi:lysophospholipase